MEYLRPELIDQADITRQELHAAWNSFNFADGVHDPNAVDRAIYRILAAERMIVAPGMEQRICTKGSA